ncbi:hypothetical protein DNTS_015918 [Danionella cerebrum]|uniref:Death-inducer obliterator 1-like n=1 Tax=Danionella cerebrum TaxID=2873325 RepID=A0A553NM76_9TELE|nr:hypothetical protein DNTS_015918 [Danionella translucida]
MEISSLLKISGLHLHSEKCLSAMEESVSPELAQAPEPSQVPVDASSQETVLELEEIKGGKDHCDVDEDKVDGAGRSTQPSSEFKKTWGFRRTTIAKREFPGEMAAEAPESKGAPVRRSGRQAKRTDKLEEFLVTVKRGRGAGRKSCPSRLEGGDPPSQTPTDAETASEASYDGNAESKMEEQKEASREKKKCGRPKGATTRKRRDSSVSDDASSNSEEEVVDEKSQEQIETVAEGSKGVEPKEEQAMDVVMKEEVVEESTKNKENKTMTRRSTRSSCKDTKIEDSKPKGAKLRTTKKKEEDDDDYEVDDDDEESPSSSSSSSSESDSDDGYDPNALYCICRQKHNKRFMICCDGCEEWFHGDCVGIPEARGRLMERNGEEYVCPKCTLKKGHVSKAVPLSAATENGKRPIAGPRKIEAGLVASHSTALTTSEERASDDLGIKGRIEKATNPSGKKKIKIFQPVPAVEGSSSPKCIGPGCEKDAQRDSVYCGNDCILRHAAAAMKTITTDGKDSQQKEKTKAQIKTANKSQQKQTVSPKRRSSQQEESGAEEEEEDEEDKHAEEQPPPPAMSSWSSDHNYIAVTPEKTTTMSATVLSKASSIQKDEEKEKEEAKPVKKAASPEKKAPVLNVTPKGGKKSPVSKGTKVPTAATSSLPKGKTSAAPPSSGRELRKQSTTHSKANKPVPPPTPPPANPVSSPPGSRHHASGALRVMKSNFTIPKKQPLPGQKELQEPGPSPSSRTTSSVSSIQNPPPKPAQPAAPPPAPPNNQMRSNIRRSLTDILFKRVSDSDDLSMSESEVGKLAVSIEKEMFNLCMNTDNKYKNKYRSLMFNLKDPKNKGLFYRVIGGEISPFRLVRLSPEELLSKELSDWRKSEKPQKSLETSGRSHSGQLKSGSKHEAGPRDVDMEEAPSMSDGDVCMTGTSQSPHLASTADSQEDTKPTSVPQLPVSSGKGSSMPDVFSSMLKDTTAQHRGHLFDLNCKICTGQKAADDEPPSKKSKISVSKKPEPSFKSKPDPRAAKTAADIPQVPSHSVPETTLVESAAVIEDQSSAFPAPVPAVSSVTITRRDPRTAGQRSSGPHIAHEVTPAKPVIIPLSVEPLVVEMKTPLPMPPPAPVILPKPVVSKPSSSESRPEGETALFLSGQEMMWKGFINMQSVAKFVTKAYMVSGSFDHIKEELSLIRFHPATEEEEVAYISLFSYFSSRKRFGVVANSNKRIKDLYLIPLSSKDPLPAKLLPFDGPGLEPARPNLLLGLLICQKDKKRSGAPLENEEKRSKTLRDEETGLPKPSIVSKSEIKHDKVHRSSLDAISTTPPGTPPPIIAPESSSSVSSILSILSSVKASGVSPSTGSNSPASNTVPTASSTPLQTILKTLFGKKKQDSDASLSPSDLSAADSSVPAASLLDPIVKQFAKSKGQQVVQDDRPYDPEEEYDPAVGYGAETHDSTRESPAEKQIVTAVTDDIAYDPEDDSLFDEVGVDQNVINLPQHQKVLENKKIDEQKFEEQVHQPLPESLISNPVASLLVNSQLLQLGKKVEELVSKSSSVPSINQRRDPRQSRDPRNVASTRRQTTDSTETEEEPPATIAEQSPQHATDKSDEQLSTAPESKSQLLETSEETSEEPASDLPQIQVDVTMDSEQLCEHATKSEEELEHGDEEEKEEMAFLKTGSTEVSIPLLGEKIDPELVGNYLNEPIVGVKSKEDPIECEIKSFEEVWPNSASILKADQISHSTGSSVSESDKVGEPIKTTAVTYYNISTISSSSTSVHSRASQDIIHDDCSFMDSHSSHIQHIPTTNPANIPPPMSFPPPIGPPPIIGPPPVQGPPAMTVPPPMRLPPPLSGPPPIPIPPMQGPPPPLGNPPPGAFPPFQTQWGSTAQFDSAPPQNFAPRGPPPFQQMGQRGPPPQIFDNPLNSMAPQHIGQRGPLPGLPPPAQLPPNFDGQRFNGPPPPFNFNTTRGPPPPFPVPPLNHFDNRALPPTHFSAPRCPPPHHNIADHCPPSNMSRPPEAFEDGGNSYQGMENPQIPPQGPSFRGPPPSNFAHRAASEDLQRFAPPNQFRGSPPHRGSFDEPRGSSQEFERQRGALVPQFGGQRAPPPGHFENEAVGQPTRFGFKEDPSSDIRDIRPVRGPLLPTPPDGPISLQARVRHSPDSHRDEHWRRHSPELRRRSRDGSDAHNRPSRFESGPRDREAPPRLSEERSRDLSEERWRDRERDRDRDREGGHGGRSWGRNREHDHDRARERDHDQDRSRERDRDRARSREKESEHSRERDHSRGKESDRHRDGDGDKRKDRDRDRGKEREERKDHDRERAKNKERDRERDKERESRDRRRDRSRSRERDRGKDRDRRDRDREREKDRVKEKERDRRERSRSKEKKSDRKERSESSRAKSTDS